MALTAAAGVLAVGAPAAGAATARSAAVTKNVCGHVLPAADLSPAGGVLQARPGKAEVAAEGRYKAAHDPLARQLPRLRAESAAQNARKLAMMRARNLPRRGPDCGAASARTGIRPADGVVTGCGSGSGYQCVGRMWQYGQVDPTWCGPATISEMSATTPGPSPVGLSQSTIASYMGVAAHGNGTDYNQMVNGLNHYVGNPDFGFNYYAYVWMDYTPTASQRSIFLSDLKVDVSQGSPIAANSWEEAGYAHLTGHPVNETIFHWFEMGGWSTNSSKVWYADTATTVWSSVPAYSWYDLYTMGTILGGRGYAW
jgi:hypothetical protein